MKATRRSFTKSLVSLGAGLNAMREKPRLAEGVPLLASTQEPKTPQAAFPKESYTPFGYLDNPYHCWALHPSGILRSVPPIGFGLYYPAGPGGYFNYEKGSIYRVLLRLGLSVGDRVYFEEDDFRRAGTELTSSHHSKNVFAFDLSLSGLRISASFFLEGQNTLASIVTLENNDTIDRDVRLYAVQRLELGNESWWGRDGVAGSYDPEEDQVILRSFAAGPVFSLKSESRSSEQIITPDEAALIAWTKGAQPGPQDRVSYFPKGLSGAVSCTLRVPAAGSTECAVYLARSFNQARATAEVRGAQLRARSTLRETLAEDNLFWSRAPQLEGDFPAHWKRSWVYDFETLRMIVRRPVGVYKHPWDAMQIQAPRNVLAETSLDMWTLSYADEETAKRVLLGQFQDALEANVPCMREDGTMNMVAADGSECGTSLQWCYPFYCLESVFLRTIDRSWLQQLYPYLVAHLEWTLKHRRDKEGWIVPKCSWETGMDASERFLIKQPTGGELIDFVRVAELQAAMSHAARVMKDFAALLGKSTEIERWDRLAVSYAEKARELWHDGWFYDQDARTGRPIVIPGHREVTQVGPVMCDVATPDQVRAMLPKMREYESNQQFWLVWPSHMLPYVESVWKAGDRAFLSRLLLGVVDRVYQSMDRRDLRPEKKLGWPGVSCEVWGKDGAYGGEGYGWGATLPAHIIRSLVGFREGSDPHGPWLWLGPNLPDALCGDGKLFGLLNLRYRGALLGIRYECQTAGRVGVQIHLAAGHWSPKARVVDESGAVVSSKVADQELSFSGLNHGLYRVEMG